MLATFRLAGRHATGLRLPAENRAYCALGMAIAGGSHATVARRWHRSADDKKSVELLGGVNLVKSTSSLAAEKREEKIYTMQEYMEREQNLEDFAKRSAAQDAVSRMENPMWMLYGLAFIGGVALYVVMCVRLRMERKRFDPKMRQVTYLDLDETGPSIGGPFELEDLEGRKVTNETLLGKWYYIYFGFTNCPDICPQEMAKMTRVINHLDKKIGKDSWVPVFVSLDPKRDTKQALREYMADFHPRILCLTGTTEQVDRAAREFRVYYAVPDEFGDSPDYLIDHSIVTYWMDPQGKFNDYTTKDFSWFESYNKLLRRVIQYEQKKDASDPTLNADVANLDTMNDKFRKMPTTMTEQQKQQQPATS